MSDAELRKIQRIAEESMRKFKRNISRLARPEQIVATKRLIELSRERLEALEAS